MLYRLTLFIASLMALPAAVSACPGDPGSVERIVCLADSLKSTLTSSQIATLQLSYSYTNSQTWSNLPVGMQPRLGIQLGTLNAAQLAIAYAIVEEVSGNSANEGYQEALQLFLADAYLSANGGGNGYGSGLYYLCFNGTPSATGLFSVKVGGHHLQIENTYNNGVMVGGTPHFEAIEPLTFTTGGNTYSPITQEKNALAAMLASLSTSELAAAKLSNTFTDILMGAKNNGSYKDWIFPATKLGKKVGDLSAAQKALVLDAIKTYVLDIDDTNAQAIINQYTQELDNTYISYSGNATLTVKNDYARIDGPGVWIEFTVQGGIVLSGVHYHSIWRDHTRDYGGAGSSAGVQTTAVGAIASATNEAPNKLQYLRAMPNPASSYATLTYTLSEAANVIVQVIDAMGRVQQQKPLGNTPAGEQAILLDIADLPPGLYTVNLIADDRRSAIKIVKQ